MAEDDEKNSGQSGSDKAPEPPPEKPQAPADWHGFKGDVRPLEIK